MATIKLRYERRYAVENEVAIQAIAKIINSASDNPSIKDSPYATNVEGMGAPDPYEMYLNNSIHPGIECMIKQAMIEGEAEFEINDPDMLMYFKAIAQAQADSGLAIDVEDEPPFPFTVNGIGHDTLASAITAAKATNAIIKLVATSATSEGISVPEGSQFVLDLNGHVLEMTGPGAGSPGTQTQGLQLLKDSIILIKNGTIKMGSGLKMGIQNYCNLTLDNVTITGDELIQYVLSNNYGNIVIKNKSKLEPTAPNVAFDVYYGMNAVYDGGVHVTIPDNNVIIAGPVEYLKADRATDEGFEQNASLVVPLEMELNMKAMQEGYVWKDNGDGTKSPKRQ